MEARNVKLIKIDRNGSKHYEGLVECDRCQGRGLFATGVCNGELVWSRLDSGVCWKCHGQRFVPSKWIERTPEYQAKLDAKREAKYAAKRAEQEAEAARIEAERKAEEARREAERLAEEARIKAEKSISQYVGEVGQRITISATFDHSAWYTVRDPFGREDTRYIHSFKDANGNKLVWKTGRGLDLFDGEAVTLTGTVKEHSEYKDEKQTILLRCKIDHAA